MIHVLAYITALPGRRAELLAAIDAIVPAVRAEPGCIEYGPAVDEALFGDAQGLLGPDSLVFIEKWESPEALKTHVGTPHMKDYSANTREIIKSRMLHVLKPLS